jgi:hypothetical protein
MSDYVSCPACQGGGLIPLEEARQIEAHVAQEQQARQEREWSHVTEMVRLDNELRRRERQLSPGELQEDAEQRLQKLERRATGQSAAP